MHETIIELGFWLHDNWLPAILVGALAVLLLRLVIVGRRSRHWTFPEAKGKAAGTAAGVVGAAVGAELAPDGTAALDHAAGHAPADHAPPSNSPHDGGGHAHHDGAAGHP